MNTINDKIDKAILDFYLTADDQTIDHILDEHIDNMDEFNKQNDKYLKKIRFLTKSIANQQKNEQLLNLAVEKIQNAIKNNIDKPIAYFNKLVASQKTVTYYRNLDQLSKEDIIEIIKDQNLVELIEKLEHNEI